MSPTSNHAMKVQILTLIVGVTLRVAIASADSDQSENAIPEDMVISSESAGKRQINTPEVFLQLKYDEGQLKRIYLAQFQKPGKAWSPSVADRSNLCADLCHAGLGGRACGDSCSQLIPMGLHTTLNNVTANSTEDVEEYERNGMYGQPRVGVCPILCNNYMGQPLCQCRKRQDEILKVNWEGICDAFCMDGYNLAGCPTCEARAPPIMRQRLLDTVEGWAAWCDVQCRQGHGGAACNCDRTPF